MIISFILKYKLSILGVLLGGVGGFLYYKEIGCANGTCPITSNPYLTVIYGALVGYLLLSSFDK